MASAEPSVLRAPELHAHLASERCPWCDQAIPHEKFDEIQARIQAKQRQRSEAQEKALREQFAKEKADDEAKAKAALEQVQKDAAAALERAKHESAKREAEAREDAMKRAEAALMPRVTAAEAAKKTAEEQLKAAKAEQERLLNERVQKELSLQRESLEKAKTEAVQKEQANAFEGRQKLEKKLVEMQRQLQNKTAQELGEGAEVDLFEALRGAFKDDRINRIDKGTPGADIRHDVVHNGASCGRIVYDSKNHTGWRFEFLTKLREDQLAAKADHAVLSTRALPRGKHQLDFQDGVVIANPARVVTVVTMLREHIVQAYRLRLSGQERNKKTTALYQFINSERCNQLFAQFDTLAQDMLELEVAEKKAHDRAWETRGRLIRNVQKVIQGRLRSQIQEIIEGVSSS